MLNQILQNLNNNNFPGLRPDPYSVITRHITQLQEAKHTIFILSPFFQLSTARYPKKCFFLDLLNHRLSAATTCVSYFAACRNKANHQDRLSVLSCCNIGAVGVKSARNQTNDDMLL
jgi:hypothetical protein